MSENILFNFVYFLFTPGPLNIAIGNPNSWGWRGRYITSILKKKGEGADLLCCPTPPPHPAHFLCYLHDIKIERH